MSVGRITSVVNYSKTQPAFKSKSKNISMGEAPTVKAGKKSSKLPYIAGGVILAGLGALYVVSHKAVPKNIFVHNGIKLGDKAVTQKINNVRWMNVDEVEKIIQENTGFGMLDLNKMDAAGLMRAKDLTRPDYLHEAANIIEESYKVAYQKAMPVEGENMLNKICNRFNTESKALIEVYVQMPYKEALERARCFGEDVFAIEKKAGMSAKEYFNKVAAFIDEKRVVS